MEICYWCCHLLDNSSIFMKSAPDAVTWITPPFSHVQTSLFLKYRKQTRYLSDTQTFSLFPGCVSSPILPGKSIQCLDSVCKQQDKCHLWDSKETWNTRHEALALPGAPRKRYKKANSKPVFLYNQSRRQHSSREFWMGALIISNAAWPSESSKATFP